MRRRTAAAAGVLALAAVAGTVWVATGPAAGDGDATGDPSADPAAAASTGTAEVVRRTLRETVTVSGTLGHGTTTPVAAGAAGTLTSVEAAGSTVRRGEALYRLDDDPVVLLYGTLPAYRVLRPGLSGRDVRQFEKNLAALGYDGFTVDDSYSWATARAVREWQDDLGRARTGTVDPAAVVVRDGAVRVDTVALVVGASVQPGTQVLTTTGRERVVQATVDLGDRPYAKVGSKVDVELPDGSTARGKVASAHTVTSAGEDDDSAATDLAIEVTLDDAKAAGGYDAAGVDVDLVVDTAKDALAVPVSALLALAEGGYAVERVGASGSAAPGSAATDGAAGTRQLIAVETGIFADGLVEVTSGELAEGDTVVVPA